MGVIKRLSETVQNKIAAGEVVERPASVVKELVENAIDAGARNISVELEGGGHRLVRVADDGVGMSEDDLILAMERHATSKISDVDDIFHIRSLGFRGEALPSIASVSRTTVTTGLADAEKAHQIVVEAGRTIRVTPAKHRTGTMVEVRDIFFNTPARRKFLRTPGSDNAQAAEILTRLALAHPELGFRLQIDGHITFAAHPVESLLSRIGELFGPVLAGKLLPLARDVKEGFAVNGYIAAPPESRHNSNSIYFLVNHRWIKNFPLASAIAAVFKSALPPKKFPFAVINLDVDPERLDVNVHPTKEEIRFANEELVKKGVAAAVKAAIKDYAATAPGSFSTGRPAAEPSTPWRAASILPAKPEQDFPTRQPPVPPSGLRHPPPSSLTVAPPFLGKQAHSKSQKEDWSGFDAAATREAIRGESSKSVPPSQPTHTSAPAGGEDKTKEMVSGKRYRILGQVSGQYIVVEGPGGLHIVDPHALHERWNFDRLIAEGKRGMASNRLLLPVEIRLSPAEDATVPEAVTVLSEHGFELRLPEANILQVAATPSYLKPQDIEPLIHQILNDIDSAASAVEERRERLLASLACRSSVLLGKNLPEEEVTELIDKLLHAGQLPTCPHGRPTTFVLTLEEIAKRLGR